MLGSALACLFTPQHIATLSVRPNYHLGTTTPSVINLLGDRTIKTFLVQSKTHIISAYQDDNDLVIEVPLNNTMIPPDIPCSEQ